MISEPTTAAPAAAASSDTAANTSFSVSCLRSEDVHRHLTVPPDLSGTDRVRAPGRDSGAGLQAAIDRATPASSACRSTLYATRSPRAPTTAAPAVGCGEGPPDVGRQIEEGVFRGSMAAPGPPAIARLPRTGTRATRVRCHSRPAQLPQRQSCIVHRAVLHGVERHYVDGTRFWGGPPGAG